MSIASSESAIQAPVRTAPAESKLLSVGPSGALSAAERADGLLWRFRAGAPIVAAPALAPDGTIYVATTEGYLHALSDDGTFRWSYTLNGPVMVAPIVDRHNVVYVGTAAGKLYAFASTGSANWGFRPPFAPTTDLIFGQRGQLQFGGRDGGVYAMSARGGALWRTPVPGGISAGPVLGPRGELVLGTLSAELVLIDKSQRKRRISLPAPLSSEPLPTRDGFYVLAGDELIALDLRGERRWSRPAVRALTMGPGGPVAIGLDAELFWLTADGQVRNQVRLGLVVSAKPVVSLADRVFVPTEQGVLLVAGQQGELERQVTVSGVALGRPVLDEARGRLAVAAHDGTLVAVRAGDLSGRQP